MVDPNDATLAPVWTALRIFLLSIGAAMLDHGFTAKSNAYTTVTIAAGLVTTIGPAAWGVYAAFTNARRARRARAVAVQAGVNLVTSGAALSDDGRLLSVTHPTGSSTPPKPVTEATAAQIVRNFAPTETPKAA